MGQLIIWLVTICLSGFVACTASETAARMRTEVKSDTVLRTKRTVGSGNDFINCLAIGELQQRYCSYDQSLLSTIVRTFTQNNSKPIQLVCPEGRVFRIRCNVCECKTSGSLECSTDLCAEDFFDAKGLPKYW